jgi:aldose 1-epimerase
MMLKKHYFILPVLVVLVIISNINCQSDNMKIAKGVVFPEAGKFEKMVNGRQVSLFTLENRNGMRADITNYGGRIVSLLIPDRNGIFDDVVTGYHTIDEFIDSGEPYFGALIGRYGNRIGGAVFTIDGNEYRLAANNGPNHLHGGPGGFHNIVWEAKQTGNTSLELTYLSPHMEEGYPGNLNVMIKYILTDDNELIIEYYAETDQKTVFNPTSHAFFNLGGEGSNSINNHMLMINADYFTPVDETLIPLGTIEPVEGTPFDFREYTPIGERVDEVHQQLVYGNGYDHNFVLNNGVQPGELSLAASVYHPGSGRMMDIYTTEPGIQFYGGNFLNGTEIGKRGEPYLFRSSFCLETQHFPDSPNKPDFPSVVLEPGTQFFSKTVHSFTVKNP